MKLAVVMPQARHGSMVDFGILLCTLLANDPDREEGRQVSFYVPEDHDRSGMAKLPDGVAVRGFIQLPVKPSDTRFKHLLRSSDIPAAYREDDHTYIVSADGSPDLIECDALICLTGLFRHGPLLPIRPYVVYAPDVIQRIVPQIYGGVLDSPCWSINSDQCVTMQNSGGVFVTSPRTGADVTSYAGVARRRVRLLPMIDAPLFETRVPRDDAARPGKDGHFLWVTSAAAQENHVRAIKALAAYYGEHDGCLDCLMCGPDTDLFTKDGSSAPDLQEFVALKREFGAFGGRLRIEKAVSRTAYRDLLSRAAFLWHPVLYGSGTFSVIEAASLGVRSLVAAYPQMRHICQTFAINAGECDPWSSADMGSALKRMEVETLGSGAAATMERPPLLESEFVTGLNAMIQAARSSFAAEIKGLQA